MTALHRVWAIGKVTFSEVIRDKLLYGAVMISIGLLAMGFLASQLSFARPDRIVLDFGLAAISIASVAIGILVGAPLIGKEFERRTAYVVLSRPITRMEFLIGKYVGLVAVLTANWALLSVFYFAILLTTGGEIHGTLLIAVVFVLFQSALAGILAMLISTFSTTSLSVMITTGLYLVGTNVSQIRMVASRMEDSAARWFLEKFAFLVPNFEYFNLETKVTYGLPVPNSLIANSVFYGVSVILFYMILAGILVRRKEQ